MAESIVGAKQPKPTSKLDQVLGKSQAVKEQASELASRVEGVATEMFGDCPSPVSPGGDPSEGEVGLLDHNLGVISDILKDINVQLDRFY